MHCSIFSSILFRRNCSFNQDLFSEIFCRSIMPLCRWLGQTWSSGDNSLLMKATPDAWFSGHFESYFLVFLCLWIINMYHLFVILYHQLLYIWRGELIGILSRLLQCLSGSVLSSERKSSVKKIRAEHIKCLAR